MRRIALGHTLLGLALLGLTLHGAPPATATPGADDERSAVLLERECRSELSTRELTLFANGTVRLWETLRLENTVGLAEESEGERQMYLGELAPDELATYVERLQGEDLGEAGPTSDGPRGAWVDQCRMVLHFDAMARWHGPPRGDDADSRDWEPEGTLSFRYGRFDSLSLSLSRVVDLVDLIAARVDRAVGRNSLPPEYIPRVGDVLRRADGVLFRVVRGTAEGGGWELQGVEQPLVVYVVESEMARVFVEVVEER